MKISEIGKKIVETQSKKQGLKNRFGLGKLRFTLKLTIEKVFWVFFMLVIIIELIVIYNSVIGNLFFKEPSEEQTESVVARVNFPNFERVTKRLDKVSGFRVSNNIDFFGSQPGIGRSNPFDDP